MLTHDSANRVHLGADMLDDGELRALRRVYENLGHDGETAGLREWYRQLADQLKSVGNNRFYLLESLIERADLPSWEQAAAAEGEE